jgi:phytoene desaturase
MRQCDWEAAGSGFRAMALRQLEKIGITDVERRIRVERRLTPAGGIRSFICIWARRSAWRIRCKQMLHLRPHNRFEDLDGVYLVGGGTHPGAGCR